MLKINRCLLALMFGVLFCGSWSAFARDESAPLCEDRSIYQKGFGGEITYVYVTVINSLSQDGTPPVPFSAVNSYQYQPEQECPEAQVIFQVGNAKGEKGFTTTGTIKVRGRSTTNSGQKSYKIKFENSEWEGQTEINLNKHMYDLTRIRNKLSFDYFRIIPDFTSLRTRFVNLWIKDMTAAHPTGKYVNYGLFTQIEEPDKNFLKAHGLDPKANFYKANFFEFQRYPDNLKERNDPTYDKKKFEEILEIYGSKKHQKLLKMLDDLNDPEIRTEEIIAKYFNLDNLTTWLAVNILMGNNDTNSQNFFLYSPSNSNTWYLMPWDYDCSWGYQTQLGRRHSPKPAWQTGLANYWGMTLFNRMFRVPEYVQAISIKMEAVAAILNEKTTREMLDRYYPVVSKFVINRPDSKLLPGGIGAYKFEYDRIAKAPAAYYNLYYSHLENPMPYFMADPELNEGQLVFSWDASFDLQGDPLTYVFQLSQDPDFRKINDEQRLNTNEYVRSLLQPGTYYYRVIAYDHKGNSQLSFDEFVDSKGKAFFGVHQFVIK